MSLVGEKVTSIEILAKRISSDLASISVKASEEVLRMVVQVSDAIDVLRIYGKLKAWKQSFSLFAFGSLFLVAWVNWVVPVDTVIRRRDYAEVLSGNAVVVILESLS